MKKIFYQTNRYIFTAKNFKSNLIAVIQCRLGKEFLPIQTASICFHFLLTLVSNDRGSTTSSSCAGGTLFARKENFCFVYKRQKHCSFMYLSLKVFIKGCPVLWTCKIQGAQHSISMKKLRFVSCPKPKVRCQGPVGTARGYPRPVFRSIAVLRLNIWTKPIDHIVSVSFVLSAYT